MMTTWEKLDQDRTDLDQALALIREHCPGAIAVNLQTSDQGHYGFVIASVEYESGQAIEGSLESALWPAEVDDQLYVLLSDLDWDGVVGESEQGYARITLTEPEEPSR